MAWADLSLIFYAVISVAIAVFLIVRMRIHPFIGLMTGAVILALARDLGVQQTIEAVEHGFGTIMGGAGLVVALGLTLGAMLQMSGAARVIATATIGAVPVRYRSWSCLLAAMILGLPLFFETGVVLLLPIVGALASDEDIDGRERLALMLPAIAGLATLHGLLPPHPGPMIAVAQLHADIGRTMLYGLILAVPAAILAGPVFARLTRGWAVSREILEEVPEPAQRAPLGISLLIVLAPVLLIAAKGLSDIMAFPPAIAPTIAFLGAPPIALLFANLLGLVLLFGPAGRRVDMDALWRLAMEPAGAILLSIGAGGILKQVLVEAGLANLLSRIAQEGSISPVLMGWGVAVLIRLATGSSTVATITASGVMAGAVGAAGGDPAWVVLAIGAGSLFLSHVNDPGFWLVKGYLGTSTVDTFKTWSMIATLVSIIGLVGIWVGSSLF